MIQHMGTLSGIATALTDIKGTGFVKNTDSLKTVKDNLLTAADVNAGVDGALNTAIPGSPTADSINAYIKELKIRKSYGVSTYLLSDDIYFSNDDLVDSDEIAYTVKKKIKCPISGNVRVKFSIKTKGVAGQFARGKIYKNGIAHGTEKVTSTINWEFHSEDLAFVSGDVIELWCYGWPGPIGYQMKDLRILGKIYQEFENTMT